MLTTTKLQLQGAGLKGILWTTWRVGSQLVLHVYMYTPDTQEGRTVMCGMPQQGVGNLAVLPGIPAFSYNQQ